MSTSASTRTNLLAGAVAIIVMVLAFFIFGGGSNEDTVVAAGDEAVSTSAVLTSAVPTTAVPTSAGSASTSTAVAESSTTIVAEPEAAPRFSDLPSIEPVDLPVEAIDTLLLIADGGPYPYRQDDGVFQNREGILPDRDVGHYREYTVDTPGSDDRGARRIVAGADGELYYTDDHYDSFREIAP